MRFLTVGKQPQYPMRFRSRYEDDSRDLIGQEKAKEGAPPTHARAVWGYAVRGFSEGVGSAIGLAAAGGILYFFFERGKKRK